MQTTYRIYKLALLPVIVAMLSISTQAAASTSAERERNARQKKLDEACEQARQEKLAPLKAQFTQECIDKGRGPAWCKKFHADYGTQAGKRAPLFYDLPECVEAFEFRKAYRSAD